MGDSVRDKLAKLIGRFGQELVDDPKRCEGLLRDVCGQDHRREVFVLASALREGVGTELRQPHAGTPVEVVLARLETRLHDHLGLAEDLARWAVQSWALVLGVVTADTLSARHGGETESAVPRHDRSESKNHQETRIKELVSELS